MTAEKVNPLSPALQELEARALDLREYAGHSVSKVWIQYLDALEAVYREDLVNCDADALRGKQALVKQLRKLKRVACADNINGRV